jgi:hypothetical protein
MSLVEVEFDIKPGPIPDDVAWLIADGQRYVDQFSDANAATVPAFVPSDFELVYHGLAAIESRRLAPGRRFLEWGSGIGVITCLAARLGFDAVGIEIERELVGIANRLAEEHGIAAEFAHGSFLPHGAEPRLEMPDDVAWLSTSGPNGYEELDLEPDEFDIVFAYPWPGEEQVIFDVFSDCAAVGALLLTYHGHDGLRLQRKVR